MARLAKSQCMQSTRTFDNLGFNAFSAVPVSAGRGQLLQPLEQRLSGLTLSACMMETLPEKR